MSHILAGTINGEPFLYMVIGLSIIIAMVLVLPFTFKIIEKNLEPFFLLMGILAVTISGLWSWDLVLEALKAPVTIGNIPIGIFQAVLIFGILLFYFNEKFCNFIANIEERIGLRIFIFLLVIILGLISSIVSVIVASVLLSEIIAALPLDRKNRIRLAVLTCFAVGLGAVLTPLGEPLSTMLVRKLATPPFYAGFSFSFTHFAVYVIPGITVIAFFASIWIGRKVTTAAQENKSENSDNIRRVILRAIRVYLFVAALVLLGEGLKPLMVWYFTKIPAFAFFWINSLSAVLDNATLTTVEISATMSIYQIMGIIMGLLIAGGMLIPGNILNIVTAGRLKISMKEWAVIGVPIGFALMTTYFLILLPILFK
jgi:predicted cation transporter